jgi:hypothetical protein
MTAFLMASDGTSSGPLARCTRAMIWLTVVSAPLRRLVIAIGRAGAAEMDTHGVGVGLGGTLVNGANPRMHFALTRHGPDFWLREPADVHRAGIAAARRIPLQTFGQ